MAQQSGVAEVIERLDQIVAHGRAANSRVAYFAVLYRLVTEAVQAGLTDGRFADPARLARFTALFADRYFDALDRYAHADAPPRCWVAAFRSAASWRPTVIQHLLLSMNAHINYDLGIAVAHSAPAADLALLRGDFEIINDLIAELTERVDVALTRIWPAYRVLDALGGRKDEAILNFSIRHARTAAWAAAERLAVLDQYGQQSELRRVDQATLALARKIRTPGLKLTLALLLVRAQEQGDVATIIERLERAPEVQGFVRSARG